MIDASQHPIESKTLSKTIALLNMKGGVAKTTLAVNLAHHCFDKGGSDVLLIDLDPQFNASQYLMDYKKYEAHRNSGGTIADLLIEVPRLSGATVDEKEFDDCVFRVKTKPVKKGKRFDLLPSELLLSHVVKNPHQMEHRLEKILAPIRDRYEYIFIDCAPTDSVLTTMTLTASDYLLIPVKPDKFSILGYALLGQTVSQFRKNSSDPHKVSELGTVFTFVPSSLGINSIEQKCMNEIRELADKDDAYVFDSALPVSQTFITAVQNQTPAFDTKYARTELKDSITNIVLEMKRQIQVAEAGL